jgi:hypothetical protein
MPGPWDAIDARETDAFADDFRRFLTDLEAEAKVLGEVDAELLGDPAMVELRPRVVRLAQTYQRAFASILACLPARRVS